MSIQEAHYDPALVQREAVPNQDRFGSLEVPLEIPQKCDQTFRIVGTGARLAEEEAAPAIPAVVKRRADREIGPVEGVNQDRDFADGCRGSRDRGALRYSAFVLEDDPRSSAASVFLQRAISPTTRA